MLKIGHKAPRLMLPSDDGNMINLKDFIGGKKVDGHSDEVLAVL